MRPVLIVVALFFIYLSDCRYLPSSSTAGKWCMSPAQSCLIWQGTTSCEVFPKRMCTYVELLFILRTDHYF